MERLCHLLKKHEDWLMARILIYAQRQGYTRYTSTLHEAWRQSISGLSDSLCEAASQQAEINLELDPDEDFQKDPIARFGLEEARLHRVRGVSLGMFLGLMKYYRQTYKDLIAEEADLEQEERRHYLHVLERFFDRVEISFCVEWANLASDPALAELQAENRRMTNEKNKYLTLFESMSHPAFLLRSDYVLENLIQAAMRLFAEDAVPGAIYYRPPELRQGDAAGLPGRSITDLFPWLARHLEAFSRGMDSQLDIEQQITAGGQDQYYLVRLSRMLDVSSKFSGTIFILEDVTQRKKAQYLMENVRAELAREVDRRTRQLRRAVREKEASERRYRSMMQAMGDAAYICTRDRVIRYMNQAMVEYLGRDATGEICHQALYGLKRKCSWCVLDEIMAGRTRHYELEEPRQGRLLHVSNNPMPWEESETAKLTVFRDITEHRSAQAAKEKSEKQYRLLVDSMNEGLVAMDSEGHVTFCNPRFSMMIGYEQDELLGRHFSEFMSREQARVLTEQLELRRQGHQDTYEITWTRKDGGDLACWVSPVPLYDDNGEYLGSFGLSMDISAQKAAEAEKEALRNQLIQSQKMEALGTLSGGIAHDFNNILGAILGYAELAAMDLPEDSPAADHVERIMEAGSRAADLVRQILSYSRQAKQKREALQLEPIISESLKLIRASAPAFISIDFRSKPGGSVLADSTQVHQIIMNLCTNACQAMKETGGSLLVGLEPTEVSIHDARRHDLTPGDYLQIKISDTGHGMSRETMEKIFDPFFTTKEVGQGTGLGLSVVQGIVKDMDGAIKVYSSPGKGTAFTIYLPRTASPVAEPQAEGGGRGQYPTGSERILILDDEQALVDIGRQILEPLGYRVSSHTDSVACVDAIRRKPHDFDLLICDYNMPGLNGAEVIKAVHEVRRDLPVIMCSGFSGRLSAQASRDLGVGWFLMKPVMSRDMALTVRKALDGQIQPMD